MFETILFGPTILNIVLFIKYDWKKLILNLYASPYNLSSVIPFAKLLGLYKLDYLSVEICDWVINKKRIEVTCGLDPWDNSSKCYDFSYTLFENTLWWNSYYNWGLHKKVYKNYNLNWILMASVP